MAGRRSADILLLVFPGLVLAALFHDVWYSSHAFSLQSDDNLDLVYPLFDYFFEELKKGHLAVWNPFIWNGMPLIGNPNFALSPLHVLAGYLLDRGPFIWFLSVFSFLEILSAFYGFYFLGRTLWPKSRLAPIWAGALYVYSAGLIVSNQFFSTAFHFAVIPWVLYLLNAASRDRILVTAGGLSVLLWFQVTYGQLQFLLYSIYLYFAFAAFVVKRGRRLCAAGSLCAAGLVAGLLSAAYLLPVLETLRLTSADDPRLGAHAYPWMHRVPVFFLVRLLYPSVFGGSFPAAIALQPTPPVPWWPIWKDGWSLWEAFSAYQGILVTVTAAFGVIILRSRWFWKVGYVGIILATTTTAGSYVLYGLHLGMSVPYGRLTVLLAIFATVLCIDAALALRDSRRLCLAYLGALVGILVASSVVGSTSLLRQFVEWSYRQAHLSPDAFVMTYLPVLRKNLINHNAFIVAAIAVIGAYLLATRTGHRPWPREALLVALALLTSADGILFLERVRPKAGGTLETLGVFRRHPLEEALLADRPDFRLHRVHVDIPFYYQRTFVHRARTLAAQTGVENPFRLLPNATMLSRVPITTGYTSLVPKNHDLADLILWRPGSGPIYRTVEASATPHQGFFDILAVKYVVRHANWRYPYRETPLSDPDGCSSHFATHSTLLGEFDGFELYRMDDATPRFYVPERIVAGKSALAAFSERGCGVREGRSLGVLDLPGPAFERRQSGRVLGVDEVTGDEIRIRYQAESPAYLIAGIPHHPWWKASIDGRPVPVHRANAMFSAVELPPGAKTVEFRCEPWSVAVGLWVSGVSLAAFLLFWVGLASRSLLAASRRYQGLPVATRGRP